MLFYIVIENSVTGGMFYRINTLEDIYHFHYDEHPFGIVHYTRIY